MPIELPQLPKIKLHVEEDLGVAAPADFIRVRRVRLRNELDGQRGPIYTYNCAERTAMDAVGLVLVDCQQHEPRLVLRSALRPPLQFRAQYAVPRDKDVPCMLWEIPAGLIEDNEYGDEGIARCAARETHEEVGLALESSAFSEFGAPLYLSPGLMAERLYYRYAEVRMQDARPPENDGSEVEAHAAIALVPLSALSGLLQRGVIQDMKTEVAIHRLLRL